MPLISKNAYDWDIWCDQCQQKLKKETIHGQTVTARNAITYFTLDHPNRYYCNDKCLKDWVNANIK